ncbi:MAG: DUF2184 domain-containing protein [Clostridiales bacterium]|jgi:hypothetical protein|nr:DUF2184 domain-containing protein [Clostridiales bacterium]
MEKYNPVMPSETYSRADYEALMNSQMPAGIAETPSMHFDSAEDAGIFFARELDYIKTKTYDKLYPEFNALKLFPTSSEVDPGAVTTTYYSYDQMGMAEIINNYATDLPRVDVKGTPSTAQIKSLGDSFGYSIQEMRESRFAGKSLDTRRGAAAKNAIDRKNNMIAWAGDEKSGLIGVLSPSNNVPIFALPTNTAGTSTKFVDKTPMEILNDINNMQSFTAKLTKSVEKPDTLALPTDAYLHLANTPLIIGGNATGTILKWILDNSPRLKNIVEAPELNADSGISPYPGQGVGFMFSKDSDKFTIETPMPFYQHPVQAKGLEFVVPCEARAAGAIIYYPLSMLIILGV